MRAFDGAVSPSSSSSVTSPPSSAVSSSRRISLPPHKGSFRSRDPPDQYKYPVKAIRHALRHVALFRELPSTELRNISKQIFAVALGLSSGQYFVSEGLTETVLVEAAQTFQRLTIMANTCFLWEPMGQRGYVVNVPLLRSRLENFLQRDPAKHDAVFVIWTVDSSYQATPSYITYCSHEAAPDLLPLLQRTYEELGRVSDHGSGVPPVLNTREMWAIDNDVQAAFRLAALNHVVISFPAIYVLHLQDGVKPSNPSEAFVQIINSLRATQAWTGTMYLEGVELEDDLVLARFLFPSNLFPYDRMEELEQLQQPENNVPRLNITDVLDNVQQTVASRLDNNQVRTIWADASINTEGPWTHGAAWEKSDFNHTLRQSLHNIIRSIQ